MGYIYCLYSTEDGLPRYVGQTEGEVERRYRQHLAAALDKQAAGALYDWIRNVLRGRHLVEYWSLQEDIAPKDLDMFEQYWIRQFPNLINLRASNVQAPSNVAAQIIQAIKHKLE